MAENKKSFLIYCDLINTVEKMPDDKAGLLFKHLLRYVNDLNPVTDDLIIELTFEPIKLQMKRDLKKYEAVCDRNAKNGALGGRPPKPKKTHSVNLGLNNNPKEPKQPDTDTDTDTDTINIETLFEDLPNSSYIIDIARNNKTTPDKIKSLIPKFRLKANLTYPSQNEFIKHFKNWIPNNINLATEIDLDSLSKEEYILERRRLREEYDKKTNPNNLCS